MTSFAKECAQSPSSSWIWLETVPRARNVWGIFRGHFQINQLEQEAELWITADSRYEVFVNGQRVGDGPPRSWREPWPVDRYLVGDLLCAGENVIAVRVCHFGRDTFQYLAAPAGLWVQVRSGNKVVLETGSDWKATSDESVVWPTPRICSQMGWEEVHDARMEIRDRANRLWTDASFEEDGWLAASVVAAPHQKLVFHDLPPLQDERREVVRYRSCERVNPAPYTWTIDVREALAPEDTSANPIVGSGLLTGFLYSPVAQSVVFGEPHRRTLESWQLNNGPLRFDDNEFLQAGSPVAHAELQVGWNRLIVRLDSPQMMGRVTLCLWAAPGVWMAVAPKQNAARGWRLLGPVKEERHQVVWGGGLQPDAIFPVGAKITDEMLEAWWNEKEWSQGVLPPGKPVADEWVCHEDIFARTWSDRVVTGSESNQWEPKWTPLKIEPSSDGDARLLLDFGEELAGEFRIELEANSGTVMDGHGFEFIQHDGRINLTEDVNNSFRYICRQGQQIFSSRQRRGFRYLWLVFRRMSSAVRILSANVRFRSYPQLRQGSFTSSDEKLNRIWNVGVHGLRCCSEDTYTDCPAYEQAHWVGDARNEALIDLVANGDDRLSRHCWFQAAQSLDRSPLVESNVPSGWRVLIPAFTWLWLDWAVWHYTYTGDKETARAMLPWIQRQIDQVESLISPRGLFEMPAWNLLDWAPMDTPTTGAVTHVNALLAWGLDRVAGLADALGQHTEAKQWKHRSAEIRKAVNSLLWDKERDLYADSCDETGKLSGRASYQTQVVAVLCDLAQGRRLEKCRAQLGLPWNDGRVGSPFFAGFVLQTLTEEGRWTEARQRLLAYWGDQLEAGATAFWEMYQPWEPRLTRSHCHGWAGIPCFFLSRECLGVKPLEPGFRSVRIAPRTEGLAWARGSVPTPDGVLNVRWELDDNFFHLEYEGTEDRCYEIVLPHFVSPESVGLPDRVRWICEGKTIRSNLPKLNLRFELKANGEGSSEKTREQGALREVSILR